jgi:hypothetical protein
MVAVAMILDVFACETGHHNLILWFRMCALKKLHSPQPSNITQNIQYAIGIATNPRLQGKAQRLQRRLARRYRRTGNPQRSFSSFRYRAYSWSHRRRIYHKAEHAEPGTNVRSSLPTDQAAVLPFLPSITIAGNVRTA